MSGYYYGPARPCFFLLIIVLWCPGCLNEQNKRSEQDQAAEGMLLKIEEDEHLGTISVFRRDEQEPILVQNAKPGHRPYLHPVAAPDGKGLLTEYSPGHHQHQTGIYWGFTRVNGRDYFHHPEESYWRRVLASVIQSEGREVKWQTVYDLLDETGAAILQETQIWTMKEEHGRFILDLIWGGEAKTDIAIGQYDYGGLFIRMPWREGMPGEAINAARQRNEKAEGQRAMWLDIGMQVEGREDFAHIAVFDHPENQGFPQPWRVDGQLGVGPARARLGDWKIGKGETEIIRHRLVMYTGDLDDVALTAIWEDYIGSNSIYSTASLWGIAQQEGRDAKFLNPEEAVEQMTLAEGYRVNAWAAEPMITQPMAFCWDDRGRLWVAENRDYESRGSGFSNSGDSRILILEDTDRDGVADNSRVFLEGIPFPAAIAVGFDGLFLGAPPNLLFVPDRDGDDAADMNDIEVLLTGWGIRDRHETINSLHWGPDGWLYGLEGFATPSKIRKPKDKGRIYKAREPFPEDLLEGEGVDINGGVWRYHPVKRRFEAVAHGFSNPWGIDYDARGQLFISACVIPHLFHVIPGGYYQRQGGRHFSPYVYSDIQTIVDHRHRSAHGGARVYLSDAFPEKQHGRLFMANIHEHAVLSDILEPRGSGFVARHGENFLMANNAQWIGFSMEIGPEGALYVLDWHDADICGQEVLNKETGRIYRITPERSLAEEWSGRYADLTKMSDGELAALQLSPSAWHARRARVILQSRASKNRIDESALGRLKDIFEKNDNPDFRLRAMWALHITNGFSSEDLVNALGNKDPYIRAWAVQLLCEDHAPTKKGLQKFAGMAYRDPSPVVRLYLAAALQRLKDEYRWDIAEALLARQADIEDPNIPKMIWFGIEPLVVKNPRRAFLLALDSKIPVISEHIARRVVDAGLLDQLVFWLERRSPNQVYLLKGMLAGLEGRPDLVAPVNWEDVYSELKERPELAPLALEIAQQFGDAEAAKTMMASLDDQSLPPEKRQHAVKRLADQQWEELPAALPGLLDDPDLRIPAIRAVGAFDDRDLGTMLMNRYALFNEEEKREVVQVMASRPVYGGQLTDALKEGRIPKRDIPAYVARQLRRVVGNGFVEIWGPIDQLAGDKTAAYVRYRDLLTDHATGAADVQNGRLIFQRSCGVCHKMYGEGSHLGPDLTGSNRANLDYILSNILDPGGEIQDDYRMVVITTQDGRTYIGNITTENEQQITLLTAGQEEVVISLSSIQSREVTPNSLMPEGLLELLTDTEVLDLMAYLRTTQQVDL